MHAAAIRKLLIVCTGDNPLAKARGLSSRTHIRLIEYAYIHSFNIVYLVVS